MESTGQGEFITWQLATFVVLCGGVFAAAGTGAGIRHGIMAGVLGAAGVVGVCQNRGEVLPPVEYWLKKIELEELPFTNPSVMMAVCGGVVVIALIGGWLGGTLFLPLAPPHMRKRLQIGLD